MTALVQVFLPLSLIFWGLLVGAGMCVAVARSERKS